MTPDLAQYIQDAATIVGYYSGYMTIAVAAIFAVGTVFLAVSFAKAGFRRGGRRRR